jgi:hypothetical protein
MQLTSIVEPYFYALILFLTPVRNGINHRIHLVTCGTAIEYQSNKCELTTFI